MPKFQPIFAPRFLDDQAYWRNTNPRTAAKVVELVKACLECPFTGIGKPEPLRHGWLKGCWSRRITKEHRLLYKVDEGAVNFLTCRYHY
jgi:toxin YoeB